jgi:predicted permease
MIAFAPTLKMMICIALGYLITKKGAFPPQFAKGVGFISLVSLLVLFDILTTERRPTSIDLFVGSISIHT